MAGRGEREKVGEVDAAARQILECWRETLLEVGGDRRAALRRAARTLGIRRAELQRRLTEAGEDDE